MTELEKKIQEAANAYYGDGSSPYSDEEFDAMMEELRHQNPSSPLLNDGVQEELKGVGKKYKLAKTMGTLAKCMDEESFSQMWDLYCGDGKGVVVEYKIDGAGVLLEYRDGKLYQALSRGDTEYGEDITKNVSLIPEVVKEIDGFNGYIRGEFFMQRSVFNVYFSQTMKNPRNAAAGIIKRKDGKDCEKLSFIAYDLWGNKFDNEETEKLYFLKEAGFNIPDYYTGLDKGYVIKLRNELITDGEIPYDGLVIKQRIVNQEDLMRKTPQRNFAFKPSPSIRITKVKDIIWQLSGELFSPVAIVEPVELCGTVVERASLSNINIMNQLGIYIGADVAIKKSGEIIPNIIEVVSEKKQNEFPIPDKCPVCGGEVRINDSGFPYCANEDCPRKMSHRFQKLFDILGVRGAGDAFLLNMEERGIDVEKFLGLIESDNTKTLNELAGGINGEKIYKQMKDALNKEVSSAAYLATFDFKGLDEKRIKMINLPLEKMRELSYNELVAVDGFGDIMANLFIEFMKKRGDEIDRLTRFFNIKDSLPKGDSLSGKSFCFTGAACRPRAELEKIVVENGGIVKSGVAKNLSYLVTDDTESGSSKNKKAKELGIPVITSQEFLDMANG